MEQIRIKLGKAFFSYVTSSYLMNFVKLLIFYSFYSGKDNEASSKDRPVVDFDACYRLVKQKTLPLVNPKPITLNQKQITAISYFFERAIETGLIGMYAILRIHDNILKTHFRSYMIEGEKEKFVIGLKKMANRRRVMLVFYRSICRR